MQSPSPSLDPSLPQSTAAQREQPRMGVPGGGGGGSAAGATAYHLMDVGKIIVSVQTEIGALRKAMRSATDAASAWASSSSSSSATATATATATGTGAAGTGTGAGPPNLSGSSSSAVSAGSPPRTARDPSDEPSSPGRHGGPHPTDGSVVLPASHVARFTDMLARAEADLRLKAEAVLNAVMQDDVHTLPTPAVDPHVMLASGHQPLDPLPPSHHHHHHQLVPIGGNQALDRLGNPTPLVGPRGIRQLVPMKGGGVLGKPRPLARPDNPVDSLNATTMDVARQNLRDRFGSAVLPASAASPAPSPSQPQQDSSIPMGRPVGGKVVTGRRATARVAPPASRVVRPGDQYDPPEITEDDVKKGVLSLVNRGLLPPNLDVGPAFQEGIACVTQGPARIHLRDPTRRDVPNASADGVFLTNVKLDSGPTRAAARVAAGGGAPRRPAGAGAAPYTGPDVGVDPSTTDYGRRHHPPSSPVHVSSTTPTAPSPSPSGVPLSSSRALVPKAMTMDGAVEEAAPHHHQHHQPASASASASAPVTGNDGPEKYQAYNQLMSEFSMHQFLIRRGATLTTSPEFQAFRRANRASWGTVMMIIRQVEALMTQYAVPTAFVDSDAVAKLAADELHAANLDSAELLSLIANIDQVTPYLETAAGARPSEDEAATRIQSVYRMFACRRFFQARKRLERCARIIQRVWMSYISFKRTRVMLRERQEKEEAVWSGIMDEFRGGWRRLSAGRRVEIHIPSFTMTEQVRQRQPNHILKQNLQMARLTVLQDPLVEVLYIAPFALTDDMNAYYAKLLSIGGGSDVTTRFKILVPENGARFSPTTSLAAALYYSPRCMARIRHHVRTKAAYIVPHRAGPMDKRVAMQLGLPLLYGDPVKVAPLVTKSGTKRVFAAADVTAPPGAHDVYDSEDLVDTVTALVAAHIDASRLLLKLDSQSGGAGTAFLDVGKLKTVHALRKERDANIVTDPDYWGIPAVQEDARARLRPILARILPRRTTLCQPERFHGFSDFLHELTTLGGVIEVVPPSIMGSPSVNLFISPDGDVTVLSTQDQLFSAPYVYAGASFPAQSVPYVALAGASEAVGKQLAVDGVMGYVGIDFVSFWDDRLKAQRVWAVDINLGLTPSACSFMLFDFLVQGAMDPASGQYYCIPGGRRRLPPGSGAGGAAPLAASLAPSSATDGPALGFDPAVTFVPRNRRTFVSHEYILHQNLNTLQFPAFFNLCRLKKVAFDVANRVGTAFVLIDSLSAGALGALCIGRSPAEAVTLVNDCLTFLSDQVGARSVRSEFDEEDGNFMVLLGNTRQRAKALGIEVNKGRTQDPL